MVHGAKALVKLDNALIGDDAIASSANSACDTTTYTSSSIRSRAASSLTICLRRMRNRTKWHTSDSSCYLIDEAHLFVEAAHSCYNRLGTAAVAV